MDIKPETYYDLRDVLSIMREKGLGRGKEGLSEYTLYDWVNAGKLKAVKLGQKYYVRGVNLQRFFDGTQQEDNSDVPAP